MLLTLGGFSMQRQLGTDQKLWRRGQWAASVSFLILMLAPVSLATAQQVVVRDVCSPLAAIPRAPISVFVPVIAPSNIDVDKQEAANNKLDKQEASAVDASGIAPSGDVAKPEVTKPEGANIEADEPDAANNRASNFAAKVLGCVLPSPIGVIYNPKITASIRRQYENSLASAKRVTKQGVVSKVILDASVDVTTPPRQRNDGSIVISLTGGITNQNPFPLGSVTIQCDYLDALGKPKSSVKLSRYTLGPGGGHIPYHDEVIDVLPPRSVVNGISCKVETAEIWKNTDGIQYLNAPLNPSLGPLVPAPSGSAQGHPTSF